MPHAAEPLVLHVALNLFHWPPHQATLASVLISQGCLNKGPQWGGRSNRNLLPHSSRG